MQDLRGILFTEASCTLVTDLIERMKTHGVFDVCPHPRMSHGRGELWLAHYGPDLQHKLARGVFARFIPSNDGVKFTHRKNGVAGLRRTTVSAGNAEVVLASMIARYEETKPKVKW